MFLDKSLGLQADAFILVAGRKGHGKGTTMSEIGGRVTRGELGAKRNLVWIGSEDSASIDIKPRIVAAGGDPERVLVVKAGWIQLPRDIEEIRAAMTDFGDVGMLVIDPIGNHITGKNSNSDTDIRDAIAPLNQLADDFECMVFGVRHLTEKEAAGVSWQRSSEPAPGCMCPASCLRSFATMRTPGSRTFSVSPATGSHQTRRGGCSGSRG